MILAALTQACGGSDGSGVDRDKRLGELSESEAQTVCSWAATEQGGARTVTCDGGQTVTIETDADCAADLTAVTDSCTVTVGAFEDCFGSLNGDPCTVFMTSECATYLQGLLSCAFLP